MKDKKIISIIGVVILIICVTVGGFFIFNKNNSTSGDSSTKMEDLSLEEIKELQEDQAKLEEEIASKTDTEEKVMALYEEGEKIMGDSEDCKHLWEVDSKYTNAHDGKELKFKCQNCKKEVVIDGITYDVWLNITASGKENSFYLNDLKETEADATVTFETESSSEEE